MKIGANYLGNGECEFVVWAPFLESVELKIVGAKGTSPIILPMKKDKLGYWRKVQNELSPETLYLYILDGEKERPDPASNFQPVGVHGPSQVIDHNSFTWGEASWSGINITEMIIYEVHVGTFTPDGTFEALLMRLDEIRDVGINTIELMPVAQFPGERNWGYDGVFSYSPQNSYGGPEGLKGLIDECHKKGMAVILDVVYNHLGPEGNYLMEFGPYFTRKYNAPWGVAINFDNAYSDEVRNFFIQNSIYWFDNFHVDGLRLDAIHSIYDMSSKHILEEISERVKEFSSYEGKRFYLIAESALNDTRIIKSRDQGGYEIEAQWSDDLHHSLHALLTGETNGYYIDFGCIKHLVKSLEEGFVYSGQYSSYRKRRFGNSSKDLPGKNFIVFSQNHDQVGNRLNGGRLSSLVNFEGLKLAAGVVIFSPNVPLLFMGEEYGEENPFLYFVSHSDPDLIGEVIKGRKKEFESFNWNGEPPDPQSVETFLRSKLRWERRKKGKHKVLLDYYKTIIQLRIQIPALSNLDKDSLELFGFENEKVVCMRRWEEETQSQVFLVINLNRSDLNIIVNFPQGNWIKVLDSSEEKWNGPGSILPEEIDSEKEIDLRGLSLALYEEN
ncbi:malto-oligosyltrehalose trehalohydrolase [Desulfobacterota bacterium AH_259_B03_O07]|nr:malto-oligosyltrehalose trehalohydrolase [Desulfobacterota bacterium AH_259_B03_O07]